ncbi:glucose-6-phosphatase catalytic subunit 1 [Phlebotomus argentipes]|uniref:glucose-6-phosphatase catalytic subunit 1 n=1 Tax=Phlebotomus argentipes TaxID=94469 RepID=UPI002892DC86|nr:glucose-6-phosphatase catalytic subunit 1 [Phlebotomus argentipes]
MESEECQIYQYEISQNVFLQSNLQNHSKFFLFLNDALNPSIFFNFLLPIVSGMDKDVFLRMTLGGLVADYCSLLMKWFLSEPRPHWWIHENDGKRLRLQQFDGTCECTPGSPSSEIMITAALFFILISSLEKRCSLTKCCNRLLWTSFVALMILQTIGQMFLGLHFLHQCILGAIAGTIIGCIFSSPKFIDSVFNLSRYKSSLLVIGMFATDCVTYSLLEFFGVDPNWSTRMSFMYCENSDAILPESLIIYSLMRNLGIFIGLTAFVPLSNCRPCVVDCCVSSLYTIAKITVGLLIFHYMPRHQGVYIYYITTVTFYAMYYFLLYGIFKLKLPTKLKLFAGKAGSE